jgi:hypothetical protein
MTASAASSTMADRSDFRTVTVGGARLGAVAGAGVLAFALISSIVPAGAGRAALQALIVLATGVGVAFLPARWVAPRSGDGIAGAAALGLCGTVAFTAVDVVLLRPLNHVVTIYPWTWDRIGGGSTWWYLPIWWMLGTLLPWMAALLVAETASRGEPTLGRTAGPVVVGAVVLAVIARLAWPAVAIPVAAGAGFAVALVALTLVARARRA